MFTIVLKPSFSLLQCEWVKKNNNPAMGSLYLIMKSNN